MPMPEKHEPFVLDRDLFDVVLQMMGRGNAGKQNYSVVIGFQVGQWNLQWL